jgi:hypothetical protein
MVVRTDSIVRFSADPAKALESASDFARLTGIPLSDYKYLGEMPIKPALVVGYDYDGLGPTDFVLVTEGGGVTLANRGHGAFLINRFAFEQFRPGSKIKAPRLPFDPVFGKTLATAGRYVQMDPKRKRSNLLVLDEKGAVWEMENEPKKK